MRSVILWISTVFATDWEKAHIWRRNFDTTKSAPLPNPFPQVFRIDFVTNLTWAEQDKLHESTITSISGRLYYDWSKKMQRIDHGSGSYECWHFYNHDGPCSLVFLPDWGMYRILLPKTAPIAQASADDSAIETRSEYGVRSVEKEASSPSLTCCLDIPNLGTPPPDWATQSNPTFNGEVHDTLSDISAYEWIYDHVGGRKNESPFSGAPVEHYHTMRQTVDDGRPVLFTFPSAGGSQDYHYLVETMAEMATMDPEIFALTDGCLTQFCECDEMPVSS